ncbi:MAG TPA: hypothetical protein VF808_02260 [Ktedonobacterales bacterium]
MADQFDPNNIAQNLGGQAQQAATGEVDSLIDDVASKAPGGDQFAQQAKDTANQAIQGGVQQAEQAAEQQVQQVQQIQQGGLGDIAGKIEGIFGGGSGGSGGAS